MKIFKKVLEYTVWLVVLAVAAAILCKLVISLVGYVKEIHLMDRVTDSLSLTETIENIEESVFGSEDEIVYQEKKVLYPSYNKTCEDYRGINAKNSPQWDLMYNQKMFKITLDGYLITDDGYYAVALGSYFGKAGSKYIMITDKGNVIPVCKLDQKQDIHTDENNFMGSANNDVIEFIVDLDKMGAVKTANGWPYSGNFNNCEKFAGTIIRILIVDEK